MKGYRFCKTKHNPPESYGDCVKACFDTILDRDDTPHVFDDRDARESWKALRDWLSSIGFSPFITSYDGSLSLEELLKYINECNPNSVFMLIGKTSNEDHCVICENGKIVHNPSWIRQPIIGPSSSGEWGIIVLGKI